MIVIMTPTGQIGGRLAGTGRKPCRARLVIPRYRTQALEGADAL